MPTIRLTDPESWIDTALVDVRSKHEKVLSSRGWKRTADLPKDILQDLAKFSKCSADAGCVDAAQWEASLPPASTEEEAAARALVREEAESRVREAAEAAEAVKAAEKSKSLSSPTAKAKPRPKPR